MILCRLWATHHRSCVEHSAIFRLILDCFPFTFISYFDSFPVSFVVLSSVRGRVSQRERERDETRKIYHERRSNEETPKVRSIFSHTSFTRECVLLHLRDCKEVNNDWRGMKCQKHLESSQGFLWPTPSVSPRMEKSQKLIDTKLMGFFFFSSIRIPSLKKTKNAKTLFF